MIIIISYFKRANSVCKIFIYFVVRYRAHIPQRIKKSNKTSMKYCLLWTRSLNHCLGPDARVLIKSLFALLRPKSFIIARPKSIIDKFVFSAPKAIHVRLHELCFV